MTYNWVLGYKATCVQRDKDLIDVKERLVICGVTPTHTHIWMCFFALSFSTARWNSQASQLSGDFSALTLFSRNCEIDYNHMATFITQYSTCTVLIINITLPRCSANQAKCNPTSSNKCTSIFFFTEIEQNDSTFNLLSIFSLLTPSLSLVSPSSPSVSRSLSLGLTVKVRDCWPSSQRKPFDSPFRF